MAPTKPKVGVCLESQKTKKILRKMEPIKFIGRSPCGDHDDHFSYVSQFFNRAEKYEFVHHLGFAALWIFYRLGLL